MTTTTTNNTQTGVNGAQDGSEDEGDAPEFPRAFGQYVLLHRLARGGMGNVFLAKTGGTMGIEKHCVVKTLRARFTGDAEYVARFMEEARVVVQLTHRNICPVFDVGRAGRTYYLAMELVVGRDVRSLQVALQDQGRSLPLDCAVHIVGEMLDALDYAHRHADPVSGVPLHLVHRDVSPQNLMINTEGEVKLIDFGLAESGTTVNDSEPVSTGTATVMGKIAYMAPEHARGDAVDARADQFSAAVVAYELFAGERYYEGLSTHQVWQKAGSGSWRPNGLHKLDPALQSVLSRALSPHREDRYASCGDFRDALLGYARTRELHAGARDLRGLMQQMFVDDVREMRELLQRFAHVSRNRMPGFVAADDSAADFFSIANTAQLTTMPEPTEMLTRSAYLYAQPGRNWPVAASVAGIAVVVLVAVAVLLMSSRPQEVVVRMEPPVAQPVTVQPVIVQPTPVGAPVDPVPVVTPAPPIVAAADPDPTPPVRTPPKKKTTTKVSAPPKKKKTFESDGAWLTTLKNSEGCDPCVAPLLAKRKNVANLTDPEISAFRVAVGKCLTKCGVYAK